MREHKIFIAAVLYGLLFDKLHLLSALATALVFNLLAFSWQIANFAVSWISGVIILSLAASFFNQTVFSSGFAVHILFYTFILSIIFYSLNGKEKSD